jgi:hypothetical protein
MSTTENTPSDASATPALGTPANGTSPASTVATTTTKPTTTIEEALARIADLERHATNKTEEAARHGKNLSATEKELAAYKEKERLAQEATLSEIEKSQKRFQEVEAAKAAAEVQIQQLKQELVSKVVQLMAKEKGIIDSELASLAIQGKLELGEDGMPTNVDKALDDLIKNKPYLAPKPAEPTQQETPPAQTATQQKPPATPAMNPGRTQISPPNAAPQQQGKYKPPSWGDIYSNK